MGPLVKKRSLPPQASVPEANLEAALERLKRAAGLADGRSGEGSRR
jgi:hypothetical protein